MMDGARGLSAGARFALARQLAARCVVLMAYVLVGYGVPWLWGLVLGLASGGYYVVEYHVLGPTLAMGAVVAAVLAASGFRSLISMGVGRGVYCWTQMLANLCFAFACSAVVTFGFTLTPNRDADILITFRVGRDLQWLACTPPSDAFGRLRFLNRDRGGSYAYMRSGSDYAANPMMLFLAVFLLVASAVILGQCVGELLARVNRYGTIALAGGTGGARGDVRHIQRASRIRSGLHVLADDSAVRRRDGVRQPVVLAVDPPPRGACPAAGSGMVVTTPDRKATRRCPWLW